MITIFLGDNPVAKDQKIEGIRAKVLPDADALQFDYEILHAVKLDTDDLKKSLLILPVISQKRLIVIRNAHKLSAAHQKILSEFFSTKPKHVELIFDSEAEDVKGKFFTQCKKSAKTYRFSSDPQANVFDMTRAMSARNPGKALKILSELLAEGNHPLQIIGALIWFWGKSKNQMSRERFKEGLDDLKEADLNIKRSRLSPEQAVELLVVKLSSLIAC